MEILKCKICNNNYNGNKGLAHHVHATHKITPQEYYDMYELKNKRDKYCGYCGKEKKFYGLKIGYPLACSQQHANQILFGVNWRFQSPVVQEQIKKINNGKYGCDYPLQNKEIFNKTKDTLEKRFGVRTTFSSKQIRDKARKSIYNNLGVECAAKSLAIKQKIKERVKKYEEENNCTRISKLLEEYGSGWYKRLEFTYTQYYGYKYINNEFIPTIIEYANRNKSQSKPEKDLVDYLRTIYANEIIIGSYSIIHPYQIDIYLPDIKVGIEYNGTRYHSIEFGKSKTYHLNKSLLCRKENIRLIHIYEFEDFEEQKKLLKDLILGKDNYPSDDFNKNNLIIHIPKACKIYSDKSFTIYGAGKLYRKEKS